MSLAHFDLERLRARVLAAYTADEPLIARFRGHARTIADSIRPLKTYSVNAVSFVSADGGDNRIALNPASIELVRVVDSRGNECVLDAVGSSTTAADLETRTLKGDEVGLGPVQRMCAALGKNLRQLSYLLSGLGEPGKATGSVRAYRDLVEWAVLYDLVTNPKLQWGGDTILVRDGLLRTKTFRRDVFPTIDQHLREGAANHQQRNVTLSIVGVAKQSAVLSRLAVALELEGVFHRSYPCYAAVPREIEAECYQYDRTWLDTYEYLHDQGTTEPLLYQSLGQMHLVKFGDGPLDPVWPVDIAVFQLGRTEQILGQLTVDAQLGFPIPDYPMCIQKAHDFAKLTGLEVVVLQDILMDGMTRTLSPDESERLYRMKHLGQSLANRRYKEA
jgi:hypothetical protein